MEKFTNEEVSAAVERAVALKGEDYVYKRVAQGGGYSAGPSCVYDNGDGTPSCIVGHVIADLEPDLFAKLGEWEHDKQRGSEGTAARTLFRTFPSRFTSAQIAALGAAQAHQDSTLPWGAARDHFKDTLAWWEKAS